MNPDGAPANNNPATQNQGGTPPAQVQVGASQQGHQLPQWTQPVQSQMLSPAAFNGQQPAHQTTGFGVPQQQPAAPAAPSFSEAEVYKQLSTQLRIPEETLRQQANGNLMGFIGGTMSDALRMISQQRAAERQVSVPQNTPAQQNQQTGPTVNPDGTYTLPAGAERVVRQNPETGLYEAIAPEWKQYADIQNHNALIIAERQRKYAANPALLLEDPSVKQSIEQMVQQRVSAAEDTIRAQNLSDKYQGMWYKEIAEHDGEGNPVMGFDQKHKITPFGMAFAKHAHELKEAGMNPNTDLFYKTVYAAARGEVPAQAQVQQQPPAQRPINGFQDLLNQGQTYSVGAAPQRQQPNNQPVNLRGALFHAMSDMPDGMPASAYRDRLRLMKQNAGR